MADPSLTPAQATKVDADPAGDLVLVIGSGDNQRSIRASSKVLSLASPVLAAMFSPRRFLEGTSLSSSNPPEIYLPEDDPEAVTMFCHIVHFREYHGKQPAPSFNQLRDMAFFCDKYDAGLAFNPWSELWLHARLDSETPGGYGTLLALAYAFDNQENFWTTSRNMIQYDTVERSRDTIDELFTLLPQGLYASIDQDRKSGLLDLSSTVEHIMARFFQDSPRKLLPETIQFRAGYVFKELYRLNIWPISTRVESSNLDRIQRAITNFNEQENAAFKQELITVVDRAVDAQKGLCLWCVRKGNIHSHQGNCHARLRYLCTG